MGDPADPDSERDGRPDQAERRLLPSKTECFAVGSSTVEEGKTFPSIPLIERWDGKTWAVQSAPKPEGGTSPTLEAISCASATFCMAVGLYRISGQGLRPFAESWNGSTWSIVSMPAPSGILTGTDLKLRDVSCTSTSSCVAVGSYRAGELKGGFPTEERTLVESWNGSVWTVQTSPNPQSFNVLSGVSCTTSSACTAVVHTRPKFSAENQASLAERWNGSAWSAQTTLNPAGAKETVLEDVSCVSATFCMAVGDSNQEGHVLEGWPAGLTESWDGSEWKLLSSNLTGRLSVVACATTNSCRAVGSTFSNSNFGQLWDGSKWSE